MRADRRRQSSSRRVFQHIARGEQIATGGIVVLDAIAIRQHQCVDATLRIAFKVDADAGGMDDAGIAVGQCVTDQISDTTDAEILVELVF